MNERQPITQQPLALVGALLTVMVVIAVGWFAVVRGGDGDAEDVGSATTVTVVGDTTTALDKSGDPSEPTTSSSTTDPSTTTPSTADSSTTSAIATTGSGSGTDLDYRCYAFADEIQTWNLRLLLDSDGGLVGQRTVTVHDNENGYFTSGFQKLTGQLAGDGSGDVEVVTWIEYDVQDSTEFWQLSIDEVLAGDRVLPAAPCSQVDEDFAGIVALPGSELAEGPTVRRLESMAFDPGASSGSASGAVIRGERDVFLIEARGGQQMVISISSLEDNAVYDVIAPSGLILADEATGGDIGLPHNGEYSVIVEPSRGNATYELMVTIN